VQLEKFEYGAFISVIQRYIYIYIIDYIQSEIQAFICYNCDYCGLQLMKTFSQYSNIEFGVFISVIHTHQHYNK